jgi:uncharacterized protein YcaQ
VKKLVRRLSASEARRFLVSHTGLARFTKDRGPSAIVALLGRLRCIQLDPLDAIGENADLVVLARVRGARRGDVHRALYPGHAFEHFAKERCILPASAFPHYRERAVETPWWRHSDRMKRLDAGLLDAVLDEVRARGPVRARDLAHRGGVEPIDWAGWKGTSSATKLSLEVLWTRCQVVVAGRNGRDKLFDVPERALPLVANSSPGASFEEWGIRERVEAAGLLPRAGGPCWSMLSDARVGPVPEALLESGELEQVEVEGARRPYLASRGFLERPLAKLDDAMRVLGPLDPLLWDRGLVRQAFGFDYVWEVYKPASERRYGWYVCPLLHRGELVARMEASTSGTTLLVSKIWREPERQFDEDAFTLLLERHAAALGCDAYKRGPGARPRRGGVSSR